MNKLAIQLPGGNVIPQPKELTDKGFVNLASFITPLLNVLFYIAVFLAFYYLVWGAYAYLMAQGNKEELGKARARITWAIIGLMIVLLSFSIATFASQIFPSRPGPGAPPIPGGGLF